MILGNDAQTSMTVRRIRKLFLEPKKTYSIREASRTLGIAAKELREWIDAGEVEVNENGRTLTVPWAEVVTFGLEIWSQAAVEEALGENIIMAIPELLRLTELSVRLPRLEVLALEKVAARDGRPLDALLASQLLDFVSAEADWLADQISGFAAALA